MANTPPYQLLPTIVVDTREKKPYAFPKAIDTITKALPTGDYSVLGFEDRFCIERKSIDDYISTLLHAKKRFAVELAKMAKMDRAYIVVECTVDDILNRRFERSGTVDPLVIIRLTMGTTIAYNIPIIFAGQRPYARLLTEELCLKFFFHQEEIAKQRQSEADHIITTHLKYITKGDTPNGTNEEADNLSEVIDLCLRNPPA